MTVAVIRSLTSFYEEKILVESVRAINTSRCHAVDVEEEADQRTVLRSNVECEIQHNSTSSPELPLFILSRSSTKNERRVITKAGAARSTPFFFQRASIPF